MTKIWKGHKILRRKLVDGFFWYRWYKIIFQTAQGSELRNLEGRYHLAPLPAHRFHPLMMKKERLPGGLRSYQHVAFSVHLLPSTWTHISFSGPSRRPRQLHLTLHRQPQQYSDNLQRVRPKRPPEPRARAVGRV